jgi:hypothetical protein
VRVVGGLDVHRSQITLTRWPYWSFCTSSERSRAAATTSASGCSVRLGPFCRPAPPRLGQREPLWQSAWQSTRHHWTGLRRSSWIRHLS